MKYLSNDICAYFQTIAEKLFEINQNLAQMMKNRLDFNKLIDLPNDLEMRNVTDKLRTGIDGWATWCLRSKRLVFDHLCSFFHFRKHELMSVQEVKRKKRGSTLTNSDRSPHSRTLQRTITSTSDNAWKKRSKISTEPKTSKNGSSTRRKQRARSKKFFSNTRWPESTCSQTKLDRCRTLRA